MSFADHQTQFLTALRTSPELLYAITRGKAFENIEKENLPVCPPFITSRNYSSSRERIKKAQEKFRMATLENSPYVKRTKNPIELRSKFFSLPKVQPSSPLFDTQPSSTRVRIVRDSQVLPSNQKEFKLRFKKSEFFENQKFMLSKLPFDKRLDRFEPSDKIRTFTKEDVTLHKANEPEVIKSLRVAEDERITDIKTYPKTFNKEIENLLFPQKFKSKIADFSQRVRPKYLRLGIRNKEIRDHRDLSDSFSDFELDLNPQIPSTILSSSNI